ncbi:MAG TPA: hypothetical protein VKB80_13915 [Kofleriaceae bacterium]|nr:hypothetical protein [Kofleriaceae bacterium]
MSEPLHQPSGLEKAIWTDADFDDMGWHDARIYAMGVHDDERGAVPPTRLLFDLDYIVRWLDPVRPARTYTFWVAPATLVFERVWDLTGSLEHASELEVADLHRAPSPDQYPDPVWHVDGQAFELRFRAPGFVQYFRRPPLHVPGQGLTMAQRGGISLAEAAFAPGPPPG